MRRGKGICAAVAAALLLALICTACAPAAPAPAGDGRLRVVTTAFPAYDFVREIAGELVDVQLLLAPGEEVHSFDPTPADMRAIADCGLFICIGGPADDWAEGLLSGAEGGAERLAMTDCVQQLVHGHTHGHSHAEAGFDEHVWTSPYMAADIVQAIADTLCRLDADNADTYRARAEDYRGRLLQLAGSIRQTVEQAEGKTLVFGDRFPMLYFTEAFGLEVQAAFPGCSEDTEPSAATVAALVDYVKQENIPVVLKCELSAGKVAEAIAEACGVPVRVMHSCHNVTADEWAAGENYLSLMEKNAELLREALKVCP